MATIATLSVLVEAKGQRRFLGNMTKVAAAAAAAGIAFDQLMDRGGKIQPVLRAFSRRVGDQESAIAKLRTSTMGLVSDYDLMQQANTALTLGSAQTVDEFAELASVAQRLGRALGLDTAFALNSLNTGIARQSRLMLDNIGLIVSAERANEKYAAAIGKSVDELTLAEQKEAFRIEAITQAQAKVAELGDEVRTTADSWSALKVEVRNTADAFAAMSAQEGPLVTFFDDAARAVRGLRGEYEELNAERVQFLETGADLPTLDELRDRELDTSGRRAGGAGQFFARGETPLAQQVRDARAAMAEFRGEEAQDFLEHVDAVKAAHREYAILTEKIELLNGVVRPFRVEEINPLTGGLLDFGDASRFLSEQWIPELDTSMQDASVSAEILRQYIESLNEELSDTEKASRAAALGLQGITGLGQLFGVSIPGLSNIFGGLSFLKAATGLDSLFGGGKAHGGPVSGGTPYMVGERGPEMFVPHQNGTIIPNGGITINVPPAPDPITAAADARWQRAIAETFRNLEGNGFRAAPA